MIKSKPLFQLLMDSFITKDGSPTLYNEHYKEYYHSKSGAVEEAIEKYVKPCRIIELAKEGRLHILDIGFGLGFNAIAAIGSAFLSNHNAEIEITSLEKDKGVIERAKSLDAPLKYYWILNKLEHDPKTNSYYYEDKNIFLRIRIGDGAEEIKKMSMRFDAVFLDPFSPAKNPELWTQGFFEDIAKRMKKDAILATYSYAKGVRESLKKAGFIVFDGPIVGRRSPCTLARLPG